MDMIKPPSPLFEKPGLGALTFFFFFVHLFGKVVAGRILVAYSFALSELE